MYHGLSQKSNMEYQENYRLLVGSVTTERHIPGCPRVKRLWREGRGA